MNEILTKEKDNFQLVGIQRFTLATLETPEQWAIQEKIEELRNLNKEYIHLVRKLNSICKTEVFEEKNLIPTIARTMIVNQLVSASPTYIPKINYCALGTGATTPANANTTLVTETYRRTIASASQVNNVGYVTAFYSSNEVVGTFYEHALFSNATAVANSGVLFSRVLLNNGLGTIKTSSQTLTVDYTLTIN